MQVADYYPLIARAVAGLEKNTGDARRLVYERARTALVAHLRSAKLEIEIKESDITRERLALEEAVRKVEAEVARRETKEPPNIPRWEDSLLPAFSEAIKSRKPEEQARLNSRSKNVASARSRPGSNLRRKNVVIARSRPGSNLRRKNVTSARSRPSKNKRWKSVANATSSDYRR